MIKYSVNELSNTLKTNGEKVILFGAGQIGQMCLYAMKQRNINVDFFCDSSKSKHGKIYNDVKTISPDSLEKFSRKTNIFISNNYVSVVKKDLIKNQQ